MRWMPEQARCHDEAANHQLVVHSCGLLNHPNSFCRSMFKFKAKFDADLLLYSLSHFEYNSHTVHMLTQQCLLPPLTSTVKSSLFTHVHFSPLSLAARLHRCHTNFLIILTMPGLFPDRSHMLKCFNYNFYFKSIFLLGWKLLNSVCQYVDFLLLIISMCI